MRALRTGRDRSNATLRAPLAGHVGKVHVQGEVILARCLVGLAAPTMMCGLTPTADGSQPGHAKVIGIDGWPEPHASSAAPRHKRRSGAQEGPGADNQAVVGSDEWWCQALGAFKQYIESRAAVGEDSIGSADNTGKEFE